ncbi:MAG TPA: hypothetical protein VF531_02260 [Bacillota bacterium]
MKNPFRHFRNIHQKILLGVAGLMLLKTLIAPNPIDVLVLIGLVLVIIGCFSDDIF